MNSLNSEQLGPHLVGRSDEFALLDRRLRDAAAGYGSVIVIEGDPGIGKSSLLAAVCQAAAARGISVMTAAASSFDGNRPLSVVRSLLRSAADTPAELLHATQLGVAEPGPRYGLNEAIIDHLETALIGLPRLIVVDDVQWADEASLSILGALSRRMGSQSGCLLIAGRYPEPRTRHESLVAELVYQGGTALRLGPLSEAAVAELVRLRFGAPPDAGMRAALARTGGNPFYLRTVLDHLDASGPLTVSDGLVHAEEPAMTSSLREVVLGSVASVAGVSREVLRLAAVLGASFSLSDLARMQAADPLSTWSRLEPALRAGLIEDYGDQLAFRHDLVREAVYAGIPASLRAELHRQAAEALAGTGCDATVIGSQLALAPCRPDGWAVGWLRRAAKEASSLSPGTAAGFLRQALRMCPAELPEHDEVVGELVFNLLWSAELAEAERLATGLAGHCNDPALIGSIRLAIGWSQWVGGRTVEAARVFREGAEDDALPLVHRARLSAFAGWVTVFHLNRYQDARRLAAGALELTERVPDDLARFMALITLAGLDYLDGQLHAAAEQMRRLVHAACRNSAAELRQLGPYIPLTLVLVDADRIAEADAAIAAGAEMSRQAESASVDALWHRTRAMRHFAAGDWDDALAELAALRSLAVDTGRQLGSALGEALSALIAVHRGDLAAAGDVLDDGAQDGGRPEFRAHWIEWAAALRLEASGDNCGAYATLAEVWQRCTTGPRLDLPWLGPDLVRLALATEQLPAARSATAVLEQLAIDGSPSVKAAALRARGLTRQDAGALLDAARLYRSARRVFFEGMTLLEAGQLLLGTAGGAEARRVLDRSIEILAELRAAPALQRAVELRSRVGAQPLKAGRSATPGTGWHSLTRSERQVAELVAEGMSNPEIAARLVVSRRTVESHMARVLMKLECRSRTQVVRAVLGAREARSG